MGMDPSFRCLWVTLLIIFGISCLVLGFLSWHGSWVLDDETSWEFPDNTSQGGVCTQSRVRATQFPRLFVLLQGNDRFCPHFSFQNDRENQTMRSKLLTDVILLPMIMSFSNVSSLYDEQHQSVYHDRSHRLPLLLPFFLPKTSWLHFQRHSVWGMRVSHEPFKERGITRGNLFVQLIFTLHPSSIPDLFHPPFHCFWESGKSELKCLKIHSCVSWVSLSKRFAL